MINYKPEEQENNTAIIKRALEHGINFFDTAENYGHGAAEVALGIALKTLNVPRENIVLSTKIINRVDGVGNRLMSLIIRQRREQNLNSLPETHYRRY